MLKIRKRRKQTAVKGRFTAMMISAAVHVALLIAAGTFVAVTVIQRQETRFEGRQVSRPRMQLQRLQVPQRAQQERQAPQMGQRVTAQAVSTRSVDFQMPEIAGLGGGISVDMSGAGFAGSLGFATPQLNVFGLRSQGEKVVFLLDTNRRMLIDEIGGIPAYEIIKEELMTMISRLPPTTLFNVIVFWTHHRAPQAFSGEMSVASRENIERLKRWLSPLNADKRQIGFNTLGFEGVEVEFEPMVPIPNTQHSWLAGLSWALRNGADSVYWLGAYDTVSWIYEPFYNDAKRGRTFEPPSGQPEEYRGIDFSTYPGGEERWNQLVERARRLHDEENARRRAAGQPDRILDRHGGHWILVETYIPGAPTPTPLRRDVQYNYTPQDIVEYVEGMLAKYEVQDRRATTTGVRRRRRFSFNVIHFVPVTEPTQRLPRLTEVPRRLGGEYLQIRGLEAVRSAATPRR